jgi:SAM-dependent methyltransferase
VSGGDGLIAERVGDLLPPALHGVRVLDVACGHGRASRALARAGASVVGVDLSAELIAAGREHEADDGLGIRYHVAAVADLGRWWDGVGFDAAIFEMAMTDIDDLDSTVTAVAAVVRSGGSFVISMLHPCFPGNDVGLSSWPPDGSYTDEGWWTSTSHNPDGARIRVGSSHRMVSTYVNALVTAGFSIDRMVEPAAPVPTFLLLRCRRPRGLRTVERGLDQRTGAPGSLTRRLGAVRPGSVVGLASTCGGSVASAVGVGRVMAAIVGPARRGARP